MVRTHAQTIELWPTLMAFSVAANCSYNAAKAMKHRNNIPPEYWPGIVVDAKRRRISGVNFASLVFAEARRKRVAIDGASPGRAIKQPANNRKIASLSVASSV